MVAKFWQDFAWGGLNGIGTRLIMSPLNRTAEAMQVQEVDPRVRSGEAPRYKGIIDCAVRLHREKGFKAFYPYQGVVWESLRYYPTQFFNLMTKDYLKSMLPKFDPNTDFPKFFLANLVSGALAASGSLLLVYPFDHYCQAACLGPPGKFGSFLDFVVQKISKGKFQELFTGIGVSVLGITVYRAIQLSLFDRITALNPWKGEAGSAGQWSKFWFAQLAINFGSFATFPFDSLRRRLLLDGLSSAPIYGSVTDCAQKILAEEGVGGFWCGYFARLVASVTGHLVGGQVERLKRHLGIRFF